MFLNRTYDEHQVGPELRRIYTEIRTSFDLPLVPTLFKLTAANPDAILASLSRRPLHRPSPEQVQVQMEHRLP